ncbi:MAG: hypothetical protein H6921_14755 [Sphingomonas sp.]|jgi:hypothetical protein|nr:hypothetical protein [Sphingomonas sp.]
MANNYLKLSFTISPTPQEAELLDECHELSIELGDLDEETLKDRYDSMSNAFKAAFPLMPSETAFPDYAGRGELPPAHATEQEGDPFASFRDLFSDGDFPSFDCEYFGDHGEVGSYLIAGTQADPYAIARLIQKCAPSVLPFGFEWSQDCNRLRPDEFGGGYYVVTPDEIIGGGTSWLMHGDLQKLKKPPSGQTKVQKTVMTFTFLHPAADIIDDWSTDRIFDECNSGGWVGAWTAKVTADVPDAQIEAELRALANDSAFFNDLLDGGR